MDGLISINKPAGKSSHYVTSCIRRMLGEKAGHCGTLDPAATGVLPVCVGKATRLSDYVTGGGKQYIGEITFGILTDSYDGAGQVLETRDASFVTEEAVQALLPRFTGDIMQAPPAISALKQGGEPLYRKARRGEDVRPDARPIRIEKLELLDFTADGEHPRCRILVDCGKGAYIRSIAYDIGEALGCGGHLSALQRTRAGQFTLAESYTLEQVEAMLAAGDEGFLISMDQALSAMPAFTVSEPLIPLASHGNPVSRAKAGGCGLPEEVPLRMKDEAGELLGIGHAAGDLLIMDKILIDVEIYERKRCLGHDISVCAIGNFDGMHLGHQALLKETARIAKAIGGKSAALTFSPHPLALVTGEAPPMLTDNMSKARLARLCGVDEVIRLRFDRELMESTPEQFVEEVLCRRLPVQRVVVGFDFTFGKGGTATAETLQALCREKGIDVVIIPEVSGEWGKVCSTAIRQKLAEGDIDAVNAMLGYWFIAAGKVEEGNRIGRSIGFPTANVALGKGMAAPRFGVYAGRVDLGGGRTVGAVINFGVKPTVGGERRPLYEPYLLDVDEDLYGKNIRIYLGKFLRPEQKFESLDELKAMIAANTESTREFLAKISAKEHLPK